MNRGSFSFGFGLVLLLIQSFTTPGHASTDGSKAWRYSLLEGSFLTDECLICGRPTILQPMRGTLNLVLVDSTPLFARYEVQDIAFTAGNPGGQHYSITGRGTYRIGGEIALIREAQLETQINGESAVFTNQVDGPTRPLPMLDLTLTQTNGTLTQTYNLRVIAAPIREIWFSTASNFTSANRTNTDNAISFGDLLSSAGRTVKPNIGLLSRLGLMPGVFPSYNVDAFTIAPGGQIYFSLDQDLFSETLGELHHGDVLSASGKIVKKNADLLAAFQPVVGTSDVGLDAIAVTDEGDILFSVRNVFVSSSLGTISHGDLLSDRGERLKDNQQLLSHFHPPVSKHDYGLDAIYVWPSGEIWFSIAEGFSDLQLGVVQPGDLLSDQGANVFRNLELVNSFAPIEDVNSFGLDGLFVVSDASASSPPPSFAGTRIGPQPGMVTLDWDAKGRVFQVNRSPDLIGSYQPVSLIIPDQTFSDILTSDRPSGFYRLRQW